VGIDPRVRWPRAGFKGRVVPITYVNSSAAIKAFVGRARRRVLHLATQAQVFAGRCPAAHDPRAREVRRSRSCSCPISTWGATRPRRSGSMSPRERASMTRGGHAGRELGGSTAEQIERAEVILWAGHCSVHKLFRPEHCDQIREPIRARARRARQAEGVKILVHPECAHAKTPPCDGRCRSLGSRFRWARGWSPVRVLVLAHLQRAVPRHGVNGGGWAVVLADACTTLGSEFCEEHLMLSHRLGSLCHAPVSSRACWPTHRFGVLLGSRGNFGGDQPGFVARPLEARRNSREGTGTPL
jgi:hypothetical protein